MPRPSGRLIVSTVLAAGLFLASLGHPGGAHAQVIDFEKLPGGTVPADGTIIHDQYPGLLFWLTDFNGIKIPISVGPRIATVGDPNTAFAGTASTQGCGDGTPGDSMVDEEIEFVGCKFLTDDGFHPNPCNPICVYGLRIEYTDPVRQAYGELLDVDGSESWRVTALDANDDPLPGANPILITSAEGGDSRRGVFTFSYAGYDIHAIQFQFTGSPGTGVGLAFDNFYFDSLPADCQRFRRLCRDEDGCNTCVGSPVGLGGDCSLWAGMRTYEAETFLGWPGGQGYGNLWDIGMSQTFYYSGGTVTIDYDFNNEMEYGLDRTRLRLDRSGGSPCDGVDDVTLVSHLGVDSGHRTVVLTQGQQLPDEPGDVTIAFMVSSSGIRSDGDGLSPTTCGAFAVDNIVITGGISHTATFETGDDGWREVLCSGANCDIHSCPKVPWYQRVIVAERAPREARLHMRAWNPDPTGSSPFDYRTSALIDSGAGGAEVAAAVAEAWLDPDVLVSADGPVLEFMDVAGRPFVCLVSEDGESWQLVSDTNSPTVHGITFGVAKKAGAMCNEKTVFADMGNRVVRDGTAHPDDFGTPVVGPCTAGDTVYFGGTRWDAGDNRWEAQSGGTWTFDSGVGSNYDHPSGSTKDPSLHALMEGWEGRDATSGLGGDWSNIAHRNDLPSLLTPCSCDLADSVLLFEDTSLGGHGLFQDNIAVSPVIDLVEAGETGRPGRFVEFQGYFDLPFMNYILVQATAEWSPPELGGSGRDRLLYYLDCKPVCVSGLDVVRLDLSHVIPPFAEDIRVGLGIVSLCSFYGQCSGVSNSTPWFDNVRFGAYGSAPAPAPVLAALSIDLPQDAFPENATLAPSAPGRFDSGIVAGADSPQTGSALGDTLVVRGGAGEAEVHVQFAVTPGPGIDPVGLANFLSTVTYVEDRRGQSWYSAQMDTAEIGGEACPGVWMTAYHEADPGFTGTDQDLDPNDLGPGGTPTRLENDIFPDDLFTPGTRVNLFYKTRFVGGAGWCTTPDTTGGHYFEMEVLPSSLDADSTWNCVLYVDHYEDRGAQPLIEPALTNLLGTGSANFESTNWDRWDVRASSSNQVSFGRPLQTEYGASVVQALAYTCILWNGGDLPAFTLTKEDTEILIPWLTLDINPNNIYFSGLPCTPGGYTLKLTEDLGGVQVTCDTYSDNGCPPGKLLDITSCVNLDPVTGALVANGSRSTDHLGQGNGCPERRSFNVLDENPAPDFGVAVADEKYRTADADAAFASIANNAADNGPLSYRIVTDAVSVHLRRDAPVAACLYSGASTAVEARLAEVLAFLGHAGGSACTDPTSGTGVEHEWDVIPPPVTALLNLAPNPLRTGEAGRIRFTMAREGPASVEIFDLQGRLVDRVFDDIAAKGANEAVWHGTDALGRMVSGGVYFYRLRTAEGTMARKVVVIGPGS